VEIVNNIQMHFYTLAEM